MIQNLIITPQAQRVFDQAFSFYEGQFAGLGREFAPCIDAKIAEIRRNPEQFQIIYKEKIRRALIPSLNQTTADSRRNYSHSEYRLSHL